jgi:pimeloyl-ACP methyl ester carboxylesterase
MPTSFRVSAALLCLSAASLTGCARQAPAPASPVLASVAPRRLTDARDQFLTVGDVRLRYREFGRGEPVVLLHGYAVSLDIWNWLGDSLALNHRVIALDERGFGQSSKFAEPARYGRAMGEDVVALLDQLHIKRAHLVGHSMGALVAGFVAAYHPERVATASLLGGPFYPDSAAFAGHTARWVTDLENGAGMVAFIRWIDPTMNDSSVRALDADLMAHNDVASLKAVMRAMGGLVIDANRARSIGVPAVAVVGTNDPLLPQSRAIVSSWPGARLVEVPGATHITVLWNPAVLAAVREQMRARIADY